MINLRAPAITQTMQHSAMQHSAWHCVTWYYVAVGMSRMDLCNSFFLFTTKHWNSFISPCFSLTSVTWPFLEGLHQPPKKTQIMSFFFPLFSDLLKNQIVFFLSFFLNTFPTLCFIQGLASTGAFGIKNRYFLVFIDSPWSFLVTPGGSW